MLLLCETQADWKADVLVLLPFSNKQLPDCCTLYAVIFGHAQSFSYGHAQSFPQQYTESLLQNSS